MEEVNDIVQKRCNIYDLVYKIVANYSPEDASNKLTAVIMAKRDHIEGLDGERAIQEQWNESQCRLLIEMLA